MVLSGNSLNRRSNSSTGIETAPGGDQLILHSRPHIEQDDFAVAEAGPQIIG
jgi:hypothetical protein